MLLPSSAPRKFRIPALNLGASVLLIGLCVFSVFAQDTTVDDDDVVRVSTDLLLFPVRVKDRQGQAIPGLTEKDLTLKDPDKATAGLYFTPGADRVAMMFALDQSLSLRAVITQQRDAALALFARFGNRSTISVLPFAEKPSLAVPFTSDAAVAQAGFNSSVGSSLRTAIFDAAAESIRIFSQRPMTRSERRLVVLISDGLDNASTKNAKTVIAEAQQKRISFYVIHLPLYEPRDGQLQVRTPSKGFKDLAEKTGGKYFLAGDKKWDVSPKEVDLTPVFTAIEEDLKSQYLLGFYIAESAKDNRKHVFSLSLNRDGAEYSFGQMGYSRSHKFFVNLPPGSNKLPVQ